MNSIGHINSDSLGKFSAEMAMIPPHNPTRYETTDGFDNPNCTNGDRAAMAAESLAVFQKECGMAEEMETAASDLICDLLHLVHANDHDPRDILLAGIRHFLCEAGEVKVRHS